MSNVIIGIIGVILFIGLAIAGGSILGSDFMTATSDGKAAALMAGGAQHVMAYHAFVTKEGVLPEGGSGLALMPRYLKSVPVNPTNPDFAFNGLDAAGNIGVPSVVAVAGIGTDAVDAERVCRAIATQVGQPLPASGNPRYASLAQLPGTAGCMQPSVNFGALLSNHAYAYVKM
jgi:hypothetical protein